MKTIVIYKSKTGFTKKYAEMITEELKCQAIDFRQIKKFDFTEYETIVFGAGLHAGVIDGLKVVKEKFAHNINNKNLIIFATGGTPNTEAQIIDTMWKNNLKEDELVAIPHFYMQSGMCYEKMGLADRLLMKAFAKVMSKKKNKNDFEAGMQQAISSSYDISSREYIEPLINFIKEKK